MILVNENLLLAFQGTETHPDGPEQKPPERENSWKEVALEGSSGEACLRCRGSQPLSAWVTSDNSFPFPALTSWYLICEMGTMTFVPPFPAGSMGVRIKGNIDTKVLVNCRGC